MWQREEKTKLNDPIGGGWKPAPLSAMICISWNCRGLGNPRTVRAFRKLIQNEDPNIVFLMETRRFAGGMERFRHWKGYNNMFAVDCVGSRRQRAGGLACLRKGVELSILSYSLNHIDMQIQASQQESPWHATEIYGFPEDSQKEMTWRLIRSLKLNIDLPWLLFGDFNCILNSQEKQGGNQPNPSQIHAFRESLQVCDLQDLGFVGFPFTWSNGRGGYQNIQERLDRFVADSRWHNMFKSHEVSHLAKHKSDHNPISIFFSRGEFVRKKKQKRIWCFEEYWLSKEEVMDVVANAWNWGENALGKIKNCVNQLKLWSSDYFRELGRRIAKCHKDLKALHNGPQTEDMIPLIKCKEHELDDLLKLEEIF